MTAVQRVLMQTESLHVDNTYKREGSEKTTYQLNQGLQYMTLVNSIPKRIPDNL